MKRSELQATLHKENIQEDIKLFKSTLSRFANHTELTSEMLHYLVKRINVNKDGVPTIIFNFSFMND
ncbi:DUF4368 domain-containing protein [Alkalihalobacterium bogoriense]|uniref:DUF4368 domain-containing protein n=1 Tax=Alkalihalobacterium bogoriense TaxID=246272 RepID=UPI000A076CD9